MLKKAISVLMILLLMSISAVVAAPIDVTSDDRNYDAISVVTDLGIMDLNDDSAFCGDDTLTRAELAEIAAVLYGIDVADVTADTLYDDVAKDHRYGKYIAACHSYNLMNGTEDGMFNPDGEVTAEQLNAVIIRIMGCEEFAKEMGGYPAGYAETAKYIGLNEYLAINSATVTRRDCAKFLYEILDICVPKIKYTARGNEFTNEGTETLSEKRMRIAKVEGYVTGNEISSLPEGSTTARDNVQIAKQNMKVGATDIMSRLGRYVEAYVKIDRDGNYGEVLTYILPKRFSDEISVKAKDINKPETTSTQISVKYESKAKTYRLDSNKTIIKNGEVITTYFEDIFKINRGEITLVDTDNSGKYDLVIIDEPISVIFNRYNADTGVISFKYGADAIEIGEDDKLEVYVDGDESNLAALKEWMSLFIYKPVNSDYYIIKASSKTVSGNLTAKADARKIFSVNGTEYGVAYDYSIYSQVFGDAQIGNSYTFILTPYGEIVAVVKNKTRTDKYAYLINGWYDVDTESVYVKIFTEDGEQITRQLKERTKVDNGTAVNAYKGTEIMDVNAGLFDRNGKVVKQLIRYKEDGNECISEIKKAKDMTSDWTSDRNVFALNYVVNGTNNVTFNNNSFAGMFSADAGNVVMFRVPGEKVEGIVRPSDDMTDIRIVDSSIYRSKSMYDFELYDIDEFYRVGAIVMYEEKGSSNSLSILTNSELAVVSDINYSVLPSGDEGYLIKCWRDGKMLEVTAEKDLVSLSYASGQWGDYERTPISAVEPGHIIQISLQGNEVEDFFVLGDLDKIDYDRERVASTTITTPVGKQPGNRLTTIPGTIKDVDGTYLLMSSKAGNGEACERVFNIVSGVEVYIYDSYTGEVTLTDYSAIVPGDKVFVRTYDWAVRTVVVAR